MKEITRIVSAQVTIIQKMADEDAEMVLSCKPEAEKNVADTLRKLYDADDVQVQIQDFVMDKGAE